MEICSRSRRETGPLIFLDTAAPENLMETLKGRSEEEVRSGKREIYVQFGDGMGASNYPFPPPGPEPPAT